MPPDLAPPLGAHLVAGGHRLWFHRSGTGGPAVVFLPGAGAIGLDYLNVHEGAARGTTSVIYDRAGTGWSDAVELPRTARQVTTELREFLAAAGIPAPWLLVGHSLGGAYARYCAQRFPHEVAGLLLLDPLHEDSAKYWPEEVRKSGEQMKNMPLPELPEPVLEAYRSLFEEKFRTWPDPVREALVARHLTGWRAGFLEGKNMEEVCEELRRGGATPEVPLTVMTAMAVDPAQRAFMPDAVQREVNAGKRTLNALLAGSVPGGRHLAVEDASHAWITMDREDAVLEAIAELLHRAG
jgi:pimeloyl-ACP methyl ester carboxylesterase